MSGRSLAVRELWIHTPKLGVGRVGDDVRSRDTFGKIRNFRGDI
jgi:hypothetical protein